VAPDVEQSLVDAAAAQEDPVSRLLHERDVLGDALDFARELEVDWPDEPPVSEAEDEALIQAVRDAGGRVAIGFKEPGRSRLAETAAGPAGQRRARVRPVTAATLEAGRELVRSLGGVIVRPYRRLPFVYADVDPEVVAELRGHPLVDWVEPRGEATVAGRTVSSGATPSAGQTIPPNIDRVQAPSAWSVNQGQGGRIWILDTGTWGGLNHHPDLPQLSAYTCLSTLPGTTDCEDDVIPPPEYEPSHGTGLAGVALALDNAIDVVGVAPSVGLWGSIRVCTAPTCFTDAEVDALQLLSQNGAKDVINMSFGGGFKAAMATAVSAAWSAGDLLVAAAGNDATSVEYPAAYSQVIAVSGEQVGSLHPNSNYGPEIELAAPYNVLSLSLTSSTSLWAGTSFAAPAVTGAAALVWTQYPGWSNSQVRSKLHTSVVDLGPVGRDDMFGFGLLDASEAVAPGPLSVSISGPSSVQPGGFCTWFASVSNIEGTITSYQWSGVLSGSGSQISGSVWSSGTLSLDVQTSGSQSGGADRSITVSSSAPSCGL